MNKNIIWAWAIKNSLAIFSWTALAIIFHKWWLALFAALFMSGLQTKHQSYRVCDKCGKHSPYADSYNEALDKAKEAGWLHVVEGNKDYCPDCRKEMNTECQDEILCTGNTSRAVGVNDKIVPSGLCGHPGKRSVNPNCLDGLPISERDWTHCVFCRDMKHCYFAGDCVFRIKEQEENNK